MNIIYKDANNQVSIQLISLASREKIETTATPLGGVYVSIQLISLASREFKIKKPTVLRLESFHSINFSSE